MVLWLIWYLLFVEDACNLLSFSMLNVCFTIKIMFWSQQSIVMSIDLFVCIGWYWDASCLRSCYWRVSCRQRMKDNEDIDENQTEYWIFTTNSERDWVGRMDILLDLVGRSKSPSTLDLHTFQHIVVEYQYFLGIIIKNRRNLQSISIIWLLGISNVLCLRYHY